MLFRTPFTFPPSVAFPFRSPSPSSSRPSLAEAALFALLGLGIVAPTFVASGCASPSGLAASRNARGVEFYASGDYDRAIAVFQETLAENPENAETLYNLGAAYQRKALATGDYNLLTQAENAYWAALERDAAPETIVCCYRGLATSASTRGDAAGALRTLEDWRDRNPDSIEPKLEIAYFLEAQERDDDAYAILEEVAAAAPNDYRAFYKMGVLQERAGNVQEALDKTTIAGRLNPTDAALAQKATELRAALEQNAAQATETADEVAELETETTLVAPTAATDDAVELEIDDAPVLPAPTFFDDATQTDGASTNDATQTLGADEVVLFARPDVDGALAANSTKTQTPPPTAAVAAAPRRQIVDEGNVKWIAPTAAASEVAANPNDATVKNAKTGAASRLSDGSGDASDVAQNTQNKQNTQNAQNIQIAQATQPPKVAKVAQATPKRDATPQRVKKRTELNAEPPTLRAGSFF